MKKVSMIIVAVLTFTVIGWVLFQVIEFEYAYIPKADHIAGTERNAAQLLSVSSREEAGTDKQIQLGKKMFFEESFGNEVFFTDILGLFDGAFTIPNIIKAVAKLGGKGTSNLQVEAAESFQAGHISIKKGELIDTGLDVAKGSYIPLGIKFVVDEGRMKAGVSCAACHATVDQKGNVIPGVPNNDLNIGLPLAMGTNTASYFTHAEIGNIQDFLKKLGANANSSKSLPDADRLEAYVDEQFVKWPRGSNDATIEFKNDPIQSTSTFTLGNHPYGWSGQGQIGPFKGLSAAINNAHSQNMDAVSQSLIAEPVLGINKDLYLGIMLQRAASKKYRYDPGSGETPSEFFERIDPTSHTPGVNELIPSATYPKISYLSSVSLLPSSPGYKVWEQMNAMSAYMNSLHPPETGLEKDPALFKRGKRVFAKAGCLSCHGGQYFTNNRVIRVEEIGTESARAGGFKPTEKHFTSPKLYAPGTPVPLPENPKKLDVPMTEAEKKSLQLAWAHGNSNGGYKVQGLYGLYWSAPYLHDGGVAVGPEYELGVPNTLNKGMIPDPAKSLEALIDSSLRKKVMEANMSAPELRGAHVSGQGHAYWIDETTGFTKQEQQAVIHYLLRLTDK